jgi:hypothetical protein
MGAGNLIDIGFAVVTVDRSTFGYLAGAFHHRFEETGGDLLRLALLEVVAAGEVQEGLVGLRDGGEEEAELGELGGATAVFEGVEVAGLTAAAGAVAAPSTTLRAGATARLVWRLVVSGWGHGCQWIANGLTDGAEEVIAKPA